MKQNKKKSTVSKEIEEKERQISAYGTLAGSRKLTLPSDRKNRSRKRSAKTDIDTNNSRQDFLEVLIEKAETARALKEKLDKPDSPIAEKKDSSTEKLQKRKICKHEKEPFFATPERLRTPPVFKPQRQHRFNDFLNKLKYKVERVRALKQHLERRNVKQKVERSYCHANFFNILRDKILEKSEKQKSISSHKKKCKCGVKKIDSLHEWYRELKKEMVLDIEDPEKPKCSLTRNKDPEIDIFMELKDIPACKPILNETDSYSNVIKYEMNLRKQKERIGRKIKPSSNLGEDLLQKERIHWEKRNEIKQKTKIGFGSAFSKPSSKGPVEMIGINKYSYIAMFEKEFLCKLKEFKNKHSKRQRYRDDMANIERFFKEITESKRKISLDEHRKTDYIAEKRARALEELCIE